MIKIKLVAVGTIKEKFLKDGIAEYLKRLSRFAKVEIVEVEESKIQNKSEDTIKKEEGERLLKRLGKDDFVVLLDLKGSFYSSEELATQIDTLISKGVSPISFVVGGTLGLSEEVRQRANVKLSISKMTFTHQMCRMILLEQIYRAFKIINHEDYHH